jgi:hypothetical protein
MAIGKIDSQRYFSGHFLKNYIITDEAKHSDVGRPPSAVALKSC